jgi:anti-sigma-K factor RskA
MMDKAYILKNGILEEYLLGELTLSDQVLVEDMIKSDAELKDYFERIELSFKALAYENAINPPKEVKERIFNSLNSSKQIKLEVEKQNSYKFYTGIAASIAILLFGASAWFYTELSGTQRKLEFAENTNTKLIDQLDESRKRYAEINDPDVQKHVMSGNSLSPTAKIVSYINHAKKSVLVSTEDLPALDGQHDYQMWADVKGEMVSMGIIKKEKGLLPMNYLEGAESLNITIEPIGGSDHPNVAQLIASVAFK